MGLYNQEEDLRRKEATKRLKEKQRKKREEKKQEAKRVAQERGVAEWLQEDASREKSARRILEHALEEIHYSQSGDRHATIFGQSFWIGRVVAGSNGLDSRATLLALQDEAESLLASEGRGSEARRTASDGFDAGLALPFELIPFGAKRERKLPRKEGQGSLNAPEGTKREAETVDLTDPSTLPLLKAPEHLIARYARLSLNQSSRQFGERWLPEIPQKEGLDAILASLGVGKTEQAKKLCEKYGKVLWLAHRRALTRNTHERLSSLGFFLYLDEDGELEYDKIIVCVDSIRRAVKQVDLVVVDEADQVLQSLVKRSVGKREEADSVLERVHTLSAHLKEAKQILLLSADLDSWTVEAFAKMAGIEMSRVRHLRHEFAHETAAWRGFTDSSMFKLKLKELWLDEGRPAIFCASRKQTKLLASWLKSMRPDARVVAIHGEAEEEDKETLKQVNEEWLKADAVLYTTSASSGVSFDEKDHFDRVFVWGVNAPKGFMASEYLQGAERIRNPKEREVWFHIGTGGRSPYSREELREYAKEKEKVTLSRLMKKAPMQFANGRLQRSEAEPLAAFVWLHALAQKEERSARPLRFILQMLLRRGVRIYADESSPTDYQARSIREHLSEVKEVLEHAEILRVVKAPDLSPVDADAMRGKENTREDQVALEKHDIGRFYLDPRDEITKTVAKPVPPPSPTFELVEWDKQGIGRGCIRNLVQAILFRQYPEYFLWLDQADFTHDPLDPERKVRSAVDAKHHYLRAETYSDMLTFIERVHPEVTQLLSGEEIEERSPQESLVDPEHFNDAIRDLFAKGKERIMAMRMRGFDPLAAPQKIAGDLCRLFKIPRYCKQFRVGGGERARAYNIDRIGFQVLMENAKIELGKARKRIEKWERSQSLVLEDKQGVTLNSKEVRIDQISLECDTPPRFELPKYAPPTKTLYESFPALTNLALFRAGIPQDAPVHEKLWKLFGANEGFQLLSKFQEETKAGKDTSFTWRFIGDIAQRTCSLLGLDLSAMEWVFENFLTQGSSPSPAFSG